MEHSSDRSRHAPSPPPPSSSEVHEDEESNGGQRTGQTLLHQERQQQLLSSSGASYHLNISIYDVPSFDRIMNDDVWSCASMIMIMGSYGSLTLQMGPNSSSLLRSNSFFVQSVQFEDLDKQKPGLMVYGFHRPPPLDVVISWTETHDIIVPANLHKEWLFFLNKGSQVNISYIIRSAGSLPLSLVVSQGIKSLGEWVEDISHPNTSLSWNIIYGNGGIQQEVPKSSNYYVAVGNFNSEEVQIQLNFSVKALIHNTSQAYYRCSFGDHLCALELYFLEDIVVVLSSPARNEETLNSIWYVKVSYGPRWITYVVGSGVMTVLILLAFKLCKTNQSRGEPRFHTGELGSERAPLLPEKDDDIASWGSSYDSISNDEDKEDLQTWEQATTSLEGKPLKERERSNNEPQGACVVCLDSTRDCFFLPCGHFAACFMCGTRIAEEAGRCPICRRKMKKVRKVFTV
ncbi:Ubiquitin-protein ligase, putative isoform 2 [Hibiscus syriacus]|uniref:Ubiquitin-protein ligase, putative isoform 2 n=1 Tax=Hibiscus syriacus TaxID=106335 RepID=A0A6A2XK49_HIBSY|nr:Ubiquitin-protein ligase, putative isoform 2 [Hibiscus syriacus]